jgi:hypothetical protein
MTKSQGMSHSIGEARGSMRKNSVQGKGSFGLLWIIVNTFSWGIYIFVGMAISSIVWQYYQNHRNGLGWGFRLLSNELIRDLIILVILGICWGTILGWLQQFVLTRRFDLRGKSWVFGTISGILLYFFFKELNSILTQYLMNFTLSSFLYEILYNLAVHFIPALMFGLAQWFILRRYLTRSGWWIIATTLALGLTESIFLWLGGNRLFTYAFIIYQFVEGFFYGVATWIVLAIISKPPVATAEVDNQYPSIE